MTQEKDGIKNTDANQEQPRQLSERETLVLPVAYVKGVGPMRAEALARLGIKRAVDLLFYFPRDYVDIVVRRRCDQLEEGLPQSLIGVIRGYNRTLTRRGPLTKLYVDVEDGTVDSIWFNVTYITKFFASDRPVILTGKPKFNGERWTFSHPSLAWPDTELSIPWRREETENSSLEPERYILPVYRLTEGLAQAHLQRIMRNATAMLPDMLSEALPSDILEKRGLLPISRAVRLIHFPENREEAEDARRRFAYQELLVLQLALAVCRTRREAGMNAPELPVTAKIDSRIRSLFPFEFTPAQNDAVREIAHDMARPNPMNRLLQGDVGAGKTAVAIYAALAAVANGAQAVLMAPTETLARQHLRALQERLKGSATRIAPLFGGQKPTERASILASIESGESQIVVGTQALICNEIKFRRLGLVIIDEQHKFGVEQRAALKAGSELDPHYLVMTATPIPRSVTMSLFGDLDVSIMRGLPPGRLKTTTSILTPENSGKWWQFVRDRLDEGRQAYVVVSRLEDAGNAEEILNRPARKIENDGTFSSDFDLWNSWTPRNGQTTSVEPAPSAEEGAGSEQPQESHSRLKTVWSAYRELSEGELRGYRLAVMHGRMTTEEKEATMADFRSGKIQVLVSTTVVEVGVDVPNATLMTIYDAERFGLAQLHQLRGRVSRGSHPGFCVVAPSEDAQEAFAAPVKKAPAKKGKSGTGKGRAKSDKDAEGAAVDKAAQKRREEARERLVFFTETTDGFELAEKDFAMRGPGMLFGSRQHGSAALMIADLARDRDLLEDANADARVIIGADPGLSTDAHAALRRQALARYGQTLGLGDVG